MFKEIETIINRVFSKEQKKEYKIFVALLKKWEKAIETKIQKNSKLIDYTDKTITIKTKTPAWKNELVFFKEDIKKNFRLPKHQLKTS